MHQRFCRNNWVGFESPPFSIINHSVFRHYLANFPLCRFISFPRSASSFSPSRGLHEFFCTASICICTVENVLHSMTDHRQRQELPWVAAISYVSLLMLIGPIDHDGGQRNNPDSNVDDLGRYANDTWCDRMQWNCRGLSSSTLVPPLQHLICSNLNPKSVSRESIQFLDSIIATRDAFRNATLIYFLWYMIFLWYHKKYVSFKLRLNIWKSTRN